MRQQEHPQVSPIAVSVDEAGRLLSLGRTKIYQLLADGRLRQIKIDRRTLIPVEDLRALIGIQHDAAA